jgi:hypothetical protein
MRGIVFAAVGFMGMASPNAALDSIATAAIK